MVPGIAPTRGAGRTYGFAGQAVHRKRPALARRAAAAANVAFVAAHSVPHHAMADFYRGLDLLLVPSIVDAWGMVVSEAIGCGVPVVCTSSTGAAEQVIETGAGGVVLTGDDDAYVDFVRGIPSWQLRLWRDQAIDAPVLCLDDWARRLVQSVESYL
jgi:glycosyltransferase involved in cell wall biosynthesis